jgi:hypothetical protein
MKSIDRQSFRTAEIAVVACLTILAGWVNVAFAQQATAPPSGGIEVAPQEQDLMTVFVKIECTERAPNGECNKAQCTRERAENPTGFEAASCAEFVVKCITSGHEAEGSRNSATCTRPSR